MKSFLVFGGIMAAIFISFCGLERLLFSVYRVKEGRDRGIKLLKYAAAAVFLSMVLFLAGIVLAHYRDITSPLEDIGSYAFTATSKEKESYTQSSGYHKTRVAYDYYIVYSVVVDDATYSFRKEVSDEEAVNKAINNKAKKGRKIFLDEEGYYYVGASNDTVETFLEKRDRWKLWFGYIEIAGLVFFVIFQLLYVVIYRTRNLAKTSFG